MEGEGKRDFRRHLGDIAQEAEFVERQRLRPAKFGGCIGRGEFHFMAVIVAKLEDSGFDDESVDALDEAPPIRAAAEFAVGDDLEPGVFLQLHHIPDALVLNLCKMGVVDALGEIVLEGLPQDRRTQEAPDMVGAKWRPAFGVLDHGRLPGWLTCL